MGYSCGISIFPLFQSVFLIEFPFTRRGVFEEIAQVKEELKVYLYGLIKVAENNLDGDCKKRCEHS